MIYCFELKVSIQSLSPVYLQWNLIYSSPQENSCVISMCKVKTCLLKLRKWKLIWGLLFVSVTEHLLTQLDISNLLSFILIFTNLLKFSSGETVIHCNKHCVQVTENLLLVILTSPLKMNWITLLITAYKSNHFWRKVHFVVRLNV